MNQEYSGRMVTNADQLRFLSRSSKGRGNEGGSYVGGECIALITPISW